MIIGVQDARTSSWVTALRTISGPIPAGSPIVIPTSGLSMLLGARVTRVKCGEERKERGYSCARLFFRSVLDLVLAVAVAFGVFGFVHILDVVLQHEQIGPFCSVKFDTATIIPFDTSSELFAIL